MFLHVLLVSQLTRQLGPSLPSKKRANVSVMTSSARCARIELTMIPVMECTSGRVPYRS
jgi:hypothetical protein